ncbi:hypothetical protein RND81_06G235300 [Saponaria officinalis]|uniref:DUF7054 domain-containing protein n=1 Tax=Saponaria officinalis TaxID=3572 RepID=A0AAW1KFU6_SAPOF
MSPEETNSINRQWSPHSTHRRPRRRTSPATPRRHKPTPKPVKVFHKSYSEPMIFPTNADGDGGGDGGSGGRSFGSDEGGWFGRVDTLDDIMLCSDTSEINFNAGYQKDAKVVITVTVEGSPGPVRTLVKLGANVDDTIKLVVQKYGDEGRCPRLDKDAALFFDLYVSYFSLHSKYFESWLLMLCFSVYNM